MTAATGFESHSLLQAGDFIVRRGGVELVVEQTLRDFLAVVARIRFYTPFLAPGQVDPAPNQYA